MSRYIIVSEMAIITMVFLLSGCSMDTAAPPSPESLIHDLGSSDRQLHDRALKALHELGETASVALRKAYRSPKTTATVRAEVEGLLTVIGYYGADYNKFIDPLLRAKFIELTAGSPRGHLSEWGPDLENANWLQEREAYLPQVPIDYLYYVVCTGEPGSVRWQDSVRELGRRQSDIASGVLQKYLDWPDYVGSVAHVYYRDIRDRRIVPALCRIVESATSEKAQSVAYTLEIVGDASAIPSIEKRIRAALDGKTDDREDDVPSYFMALIKLGARDAMECFGRLALDKHPHWRRKALKLLVDTNLPEAPCRVPLLNTVFDTIAAACRNNSLGELREEDSDNYALAIGVVMKYRVAEVMPTLKEIYRALDPAIAPETSAKHPSVHRLLINTAAALANEGEVRYLEVVVDHLNNISGLRDRALVLLGNLVGENFKWDSESAIEWWRQHRDHLEFDPVKRRFVVKPP